MAGKKRAEVCEKDITGLSYLDKMQPLLARLHEVGCERDRADNRKLHMDQYCMLVLLYLFNPICSSLRAVQQASELKSKLGCARASLGPLSEASHGITLRNSFSLGRCRKTRTLWVSSFSCFSKSLNSIIVSMSN